jgi:hypothetical protein
MSDDEPLVERIKELTETLGRKPTLQEVFYRDFTGTGKFRVVELGVPPRGEPRGRKAAVT